MVHKIHIKSITLCVCIFTRNMLLYVKNKNDSQMNNLNRRTIKYLFSNLGNQTSLAIYVFNEGIDTYNFITSMMSKRVKI